MEKMKFKKKNLKKYAKRVSEINSELVEIKNKMKKDARRIPWGIYCYGYKTCPYWRSAKMSVIDRIKLMFKFHKEMKNYYKEHGERPKWYFREHMFGFERWYYCDYCNYKDNYQGESLLWDQCKICGIKEDRYL